MYALSFSVKWQNQKTCADAVGNLPFAITQDAVDSVLSQAGQVRHFRYSFIAWLVLPNQHPLRFDFCCFRAWHAKSRVTVSNPHDSSAAVTAVIGSQTFC